MKRLLSLVALSTLIAPIPALFADVSAPLGAIQSDQTLSVAWETLTDCAFDIIETESGAVAASVSILYNGSWVPSAPYQGSNGSSAWEGVTVAVDGATAKISGLPASDYYLQTYTPTPSKNQHADETSTYEEIDDPYRFNYLGCFFSVE